MKKKRKTEKRKIEPKERKPKKKNLGSMAFKEARKMAQERREFEKEVARIENEDSE